MQPYGIIAIVMGVFIAFVLLAGRITLKGWRPIDRDLEPARFWLFIAGFAVAEAALIVAAIVGHG